MCLIDCYFVFLCFYVFVTLLLFVTSDIVGIDSVMIVMTVFHVFLWRIRDH